MATREQIRQTVDLLAAVTAGMPLLRVPLADLPLWADALDVDQVDLALRYDGRVWATVAEWFPDAGHLIVEAIADVVRGVELPPCPAGSGTGRLMRFPLDVMSRLELFAAEAVA